MTAGEVCGVIARSAKDAIGDVETVILPVADGGEGTIDAVSIAAGGEFITVNVRGTLPGTSVSARYLVTGDTAVIEMAEANGLTKIPAHAASGECIPLKGSTYGTGQLICDALSKGYKKILVAIGGSATNDGGCGAMEALGVRFLNKCGEIISGISGERLCEIAGIDDAGIDERIKDAEFTVLCDVDNPLTGPHGATMVYGPQKGADDNALSVLESGMKNYEAVLSGKFGYDTGNVPGAGAAGGLGAALLTFLNAKMTPGIDRILDFCGFDKKAEGASVIITGEGKIDSQTLNGKVISGICKRAVKLGVPVAVFAGISEIDDEDAERMGIVKTTALLKDGMSREYSMNHGKELLKDAAYDFFCTMVRNEKTAFKNAEGQGR